MLLHHVQVAMPRGAEDRARAFYVEALGLVETEKPAVLAARGGCWFRAEQDGRTTAEIHLGVEEPFTAAKKAHPGLLVGSVEELEALAARIESHGFGVDWSERETFHGYVRFHCRDGFGNRLEVLSPA